MVGRKVRLISRGTVLLSALAAAGSVLAACGGPAVAGGPSFTLYNGQHVQTTVALVRAFERQTGIVVHVRSDTEATLATQIVTEGAHARADVLYTENSPPLEELRAEHLLAAVPRSIRRKVPATESSPGGDWVGVSARVSVLVYNTRLVQPSQLPSSVLQLADPRWRGKLALAPAETDFQPIVTAVDRAEGPAATVRWLDALKSNAAGHLYPDNETITDEVNKGQAAIGVIDQYYWYRLRDQLGAAGMRSAITFFAPGDPGFVLDVSGAGVLRSSTHRRAADRFLAFLTSRQAQAIIARGDSYEYPLAPGIPARGGQTPLDQLRPDPVGVAQLGTGATAVHLLQEAQLL